MLSCSKAHKKRLRSKWELKQAKETKYLFTYENETTKNQEIITYKAVSKDGEINESAKFKDGLKLTHQYKLTKRGYVCTGLSFDNEKY